MPSKGSVLKAGKRVNPLTRDLYKRFVEEKKVDIDFKTFRDIIESTNLLMREAVSEEEAGFKMPVNLGYIVVNKYKRKAPTCDAVASRKLKKFVPHTNMHSFGNVYNIRWYKVGAICKNVGVYKFMGYRLLKRKIAANIKAGKVYHSWQDTDLWSSTRWERKFKNRDKWE